MNERARRSHERDHDHRRPVPRAEPPLPESEQGPDRGRRERPAPQPVEPVDPRCHPNRRLAAARPASMAAKIPRVAIAAVAALLAAACDRSLAQAATAAGTLSREATPSANAAKTPVPRANAAQVPAQVPDPLSDAAITARIAAEIHNDPALAGTDLTVNTSRGVVSLTGTVKSPEQIAEASARAQAPDGVVRLDTHVSVMPP